MRVRIYVDGVPSWSENQPARARIPWTQAGSVNGAFVVQERLAGKSVDKTEAANKGWETKRLRGEALAPGTEA